MNIDDRKIFYKSEAAAKKWKDWGIDYVPVTVFDWKRENAAPAESTVFCDKNFLKGLLKDPNKLEVENVGSTTVKFVIPSPWAIYPLVAIEREGQDPDIRIHLHSRGFAEVRRDFSQVVETLRREAGVLEEFDDAEAAAPGL